MSMLRDIDIWFADHVFVFHQEHRRYALSLVRQQEEAEELVQEAYARLFALEKWAAIASPHAFTIRIIRNLAIERFRRADVVRIDQGAVLLSLEIADQEPTPDVVAMDRSELNHIARVMQDMPRRIEGLSPALVAEKMNISVSTVETHLVRALRLLVERRNQADRPAKAEQASQCESRNRLEQV
jgi:RNA polymerase sigma factor (sigma-70 family)